MPYYFITYKRQAKKTRKIAARAFSAARRPKSSIFLSNSGNFPYGKTSDTQCSIDGTPRQDFDVAKKEAEEKGQRAIPTDASGRRSAVAERRVTAERKAKTEARGYGYAGTRLASRLAAGRRWQEA